MRPDTPVLATDGTLLVSVVVPVRDNAEGVRALLQRLGTQTLDQGRFEVIIADDGSKAGPPVSVSTSDGRVRVVAGPPRTSYAARNRGAATARGEILAFCDSDCLPDPQWLETGLSALEDADIVGGEVALVGPERPTLWSVLTADLFLNQARNVARSRAVTANLFVRRRAFETSGRFDPSLVSGGDFEWTLRAVERGARLVYEPRAIVRHPTLDDGRALLRKVWRTNWWAAVRRARLREGDSVGLWGALRMWPLLLPVLGTVLTRRKSHRSLRLDLSRVRAAGLRMSTWDEVRALALLYTVVGHVAIAAGLGGWVTCRVRSAWFRAASPDDSPGETGDRQRLA